MADIWVLSDERIGNAKQALVLSDAVCKKSNFTHGLKIIYPKGFFSYLPNRLIPKPFFACDKQDLSPPYPHMIISCGRIAGKVSVAIKAACPKVKLVQILNPDAYLDDYDLLVLPRHDNRHYDNAILIDGSLTDVAPALISQKGQDFADKYGGLKKPIVGVFIGGNNKAYAMDSVAVNNIIDLLQSWNDAGYSIIGSFSRRTPASMQTELLSLSAQIKNINFWNGTGANPYFGILHYADAIAVTCDSINMICESFQTGKPTYIIGLSEKKIRRNKFASFHASQLQQKRIRHALPHLDFDWQPSACDDLDRVCDAVCKLL